MCKIMEWWETRRQTFVDKGIGRGAGNGGGEEIEIEQDVLLEFISSPKWISLFCNTNTCW